MKNIMMLEMLWHLVLLDSTRTIVEQDALTTSQQQLKVSMIINLLVKDEVISHISHLDTLLRFGTH
jgi:hypothetical protein